MSLRLLVLGNSHDLIDGVDGRGTSMWRVAAAIEQHTRETVELRHVVAFPNPGLARHTSKVVDEFDPDIVLLHCSGHVVGPRTLAFQLQHVLGKRQYDLYCRLVLAAQRRIGIRMDRPRSASDRRGLLPAIYYFARDGLVRAGLGDTLMSVEDAAEAYAAWIRHLATREALTVLVRGPLYSNVNEKIPHIQAAAEARIAAFDAALAKQCEDRRIDYCSMIPFDRELRPHLLPDRVHRDPEGHAIIAAVELQKLPAYLTGAPGAAG